MAPSFGIYSCRQATALCRNLAISRDHPDPVEAQKRRARRIECRLTRRAERRAKGEIISPVPASSSCSLATDIRLAGYQALREIFPESPRQELIEALVAVQARPVAERAVHAARLIFQTLRDQKLALKVHIDECGTKRKQVVLTRSRSTMPCHSAPVKPSNIPETASELQSSGPGEVQSSERPYLTRSRSIPASVKLVSATIVVKAKHCMQPHVASQMSTGHDSDDERHQTSARKRHRDKLRAIHEKRSRRQIVDHNLLAASIPSFEALHALLAALAAAAELKVDDDCDDARKQSRKPQKKKAALSSWTGLQHAFRVEHGKQILEELGKETVLSPVQPETSKRFLQTCRSVLGDSSLPIPSYHGTSERSISSIANKGLLVPGEGSVRVAHGSAHGVGIYTAKLGCSMLSRAFCDSDKLFICGVVDTVPEEPRREPEIVVRVPRARTFGMGLQHRQHHLPLPVLRKMQLAKQRRQQQQAGLARTMGRFKVHRETSQVRHVGSAMVVFDKAFVAPLFLAHCSGDSESSINNARAGKRQTLVPELGDSFWDPPVPSTCKYGRSVKRRVERRRWKMLREAERHEKYDRV